MAAFGQASSENAKYHKRILPNLKASSAKITSKNLKLSAMTCRNGRILTIKWKTTGVSRRKKYGGVKHRNKSCIILDREQYRFQRYISDIAGQDVHSHGGEVN